MPNFLRRLKPKVQAVSIDRGPYAMAMSENAEANITMYGEIVKMQPRHPWTGEPLQGDYIIQSEFLEDLEAVAGAMSIMIHMDSIGGHAGASILIHNRLRELAAKGTRLMGKVDAVAMSGGSLIMSACDEVWVNPSSLIMIHKSAMTVWESCNADAMKRYAAELEAWDKAQVSIYKRKCGLSDMVIANMMAKTTYMTGAEAIEKGFADKLLEDARPLEIAASADRHILIVRGRNLPLASGIVAPDDIPTVSTEGEPPDMTNKAQPAQTGGQNGGIIMAKTLEELRKEDPALAEQLMAEAKATVSASGEADAPAAAMPPVAPAAPAAPAVIPAAQASGEGDPAQAERKRLQDIDALAGVFDSETIKAAKYGDHPITAQEMAYQAAQKAVQQGRKFLSAMEADTTASGAQDVGAANGAGSDGTGGIGGIGGEDTPQAMAAQAKADVAVFQKMKEVR